MSTPLTIVALLLLLAVLVAWAVEVRTPRRVRWRDGQLGGVAGSSATGLVLQHDDGRVVWGTLGYSIYRSEDGGDFERVARIRPPWGEPWGGYLRTLRRTFGYQELVEVLPLRTDPARVIAFAGGWIHVLELDSRGRPRGRARRTHELRYFGRGKGRGLMAFGVCEDLQGHLYFAEYVTESGDRPTGIWRSTDAGETWALRYEFQPTDIRHIHVIQCDPHDGALWIGTGDRDEHCFVGVSRDGGASFEWAGHGRQIHRTCAFACFEDAVVWGMDADFEQNHVLRWGRADGAVTTHAELPDATYYASRIDERRLLLGIAQGVAQVWVATSDGGAVRWIDDPSPKTPPRRGPSPGIRLARGDNHDGAFIHVNPLRTTAHEAAIWRIPRTAVPSP
ncbi:MAG: glycosyl hydrolase repeat-containing protein [Thermoleophilia bacterium]|nr:glycosyl hydrolase repeat-containing protein [Thermoleophilia bacterium]